MAIFGFFFGSGEGRGGGRCYREEMRDVRYHPWNVAVCVVSVTSNEMDIIGRAID